MILKERTPRTPQNRFEAAGDAAEKQLAFYLNRAFGDTQDICVLNDLRVVHEGEVAQIDHLVIHRSGMAIIESKSVSTTIAVNRQGEFTRSYKGTRSGMPSPIAQAKRQADLLRKLMHGHKAQLLPKALGLVQQGFGNFPIETLVAISDQGVITHQGKRPSELMKADAVTERIKKVVKEHAKSRGFGGLMRDALSDPKTKKAQAKHTKSTGELGLYNLKPERVLALGEFLLSRHEEPNHATRSKQPAPPQPTPKPHAKKSRISTQTDSTDLTGIMASRKNPACKHCGSTKESLTIEYGKFGYYFQCHDCPGATGIDLSCDCAPKQRGRVRKAKADFFFECKADRKSTRLNSSHTLESRMPSSA